MSTANGGSLDDCLTNLFALTELNGLQWRLYESPSWSGDSNPQTLLQSDPIFVAYSKLQTDGILSVWRRMPVKVLPQVFNLLPTLNGTTAKELWVFWYGSTEPEEIEKHCKDLNKKKSEEEADDGTMNAIPYDVRCLLYKAWNTQMEKHYRSKKFLQIGRWFFRPQKFLDPNAAFIIDDFALAHSHSFNIVGGNSMCMAVKTQLQPNLVHLAPFHIERNRKFRDEKVNVLLAPWSLNGHISLRYSVMAQTKKEEEEVEKQLSQWKEANMFVDVKKRKKRRREEGGETEGEESEEEGWGEMKMPKMVRVEVDGKVNMWWPTQYVLVTLEETRRLVRERFPVADLVKSVPDKEPKSSKNRFTHLTSSETSLRMSQAVVDDGNLKKGRTKPVIGPPSLKKTVVYKNPRLLKDVRERSKDEKLSFEGRTRSKLENDASSGRRVRISSVNSDDEMEGEEKKEENSGMTRELKSLMKSSRYNWRGRNGRALNKKETELRCVDSSSSETEEPDKADGRGEKGERDWARGNAEGPDKITRDIYAHAEQSSYHFDRTAPVRRRQSNESEDEERLAKSPFTPVRVLSPMDKAAEVDQMTKCIIGDLMVSGVKPRDHGAAAILNEYGAYFDVNAAGTNPDIKYKPYHSRRRGLRTQAKASGRSMLDDLGFCSSDEDYDSSKHTCHRRSERTPEPMKPSRPPPLLPIFETELVGGVNQPPIIHFKPDMVIRQKWSKFHPNRSIPLSWPLINSGDELMELHDLKNLENPGLDMGSDEEPSDDRYSTGSADLLPPLSVAAADDAGEGTSSGAENWRDEEMEMEEDFLQTNMDSSSELMDTDGMPHSDSVLSPPASNERADSHNSMYHRLPGGPHSVGESMALNKIYPTPPSLLQVDICSPAMMGGPHSQARKEDRDDESSHSEDEETMKYLEEIELKEEDRARGNHQISHLHSELLSRQFFDNAPKIDVPVSSRFGYFHERMRVAEKRSMPIYTKKDGEKKEQIQPRYAEYQAAIDNHTNCNTISAMSTASTAGSTGAQVWPSSHPQQPLLHPSLTPQQQHQYQMQQMHQHHLQSQPGPSSMIPSHPNQMQPHPSYLGGVVPPQGQMGGVFPGQTTMMRSQYPPPYGGAMGATIHQHPIQQPGFPPQQQPQYGGGGGGGGQMMMSGQSGFHPGAMQMRPSGYPFPPQGTSTPMGVHPMQTQGMTSHHMGYQTGMQNQMIYRPGMPPTSYPQYANSMGGMVGPSTTMGGMQMGQYGVQTMQQPGMIMHPSHHSQPMIAGPAHPMGMPGGMVGHPSFLMASSAVPPPSTAGVGSVVMVGNQQRSAETMTGKKPIVSCGIDDEKAVIETRRGEDPYVNALTIAPKRLLWKGTGQLNNEFELYTTERMIEKERRKGDESFCTPIGGSEGLSIVAAVMLQDTILNLHFDWVFDSCPICACTTSIRSRELGVYIKPPEALEEAVEVQHEWIGTWHGFHSDAADASCTCGFSVIRHRQLSMRAGLFIEDSKEATGDDSSGTNPLEGIRRSYIWFDPKSTVDHALVETLRSMALTTDVGRIVTALKNISSMGMEKERRNRRKKNEAIDECNIPSVGSIGSSRVEYVISQMDRMELVLMGNSALTTAHTSGNAPSPVVGDSPYFHPWGLQIANEVADPTEMEIKNLLEDVKPLIEGAVREARKLSSSSSSVSVIEGPLTWRALAAKNVKTSGNGEDDSHIAEPIPLIEMSTEREAIRVAPTVIKNWEQFNLGPIDVPKDVLYLAVVPDDDRVYEMTVVYMRRLSKMYELNLRLGRHVGYLVRDDHITPKAPVREGIVRANVSRPRHPSNPSPSSDFLRLVEKLFVEGGGSREFLRKLTSYVMGLEEVLHDHLGLKRIFERDVFRECVAYALMHRKVYQKQKSSNNPTVARHERDTEEGSPPVGEEEERRGEENEKRKESQMYRGALAEALGMGPSSSNGKEKQKAKHPFGQCAAYGMDGERVLKPIDWPEEEPAALPQTVVIYVSMWPCWGSEGRDGEAARVAMISLVKAFNTVINKLPSSHKGLCQLELVPIQRLEEVVGCGTDMDRLDRSSNLNTWQIGNMNRNSEVYPTDRPRIEDILKEIALGVYRKPRFIHCDTLKNCLPKSMTKFGPASATLDWIDRKDGKKKTIYRCPSVPFQLATTPAIVAKNEKYSQLCMDEVSLYISYCLVGIEFVVVTLTDNLGARNESAVLNLKPLSTETDSKFRSKNKTTVRDGLDRLWKFIEGVMLNESKPFRLVIGKLGKMGHGEFKAWCHVLSRSNLKKYNSSRVKDSCAPCNAGAGAPTLLSACLVSTEPEAHLQVLPSYSIPPDPNAGAQKKIRPLHTPGDNTITHIMVFPISPAIQLTQSTDMGEVNDDEDDFGNLDGGLGLVGDDMNEIMNELMTDGGEVEGRAAARTQHMNSFFDGPLESGVQNQPLAAGWMISTAPGGDLPDWFWSSCPSLKRRLPVHLRCSLHINEAQLMRSDDIMKKEKEQEISHALDSQKTDEVLRHVLEQYNDLSWLAIDSITQERRSCLPIHIQALTRLHDTVLNLIM